MMPVVTTVAWGIEDSNQVSVLTQRLVVFVSLTLMVMALLTAIVLVRGITEQVDDMSRITQARALLQSGSGERPIDPSQRIALEQFIDDETEKLLDTSGTIDMTPLWPVAGIVAAMAAAILLAFMLLVGTKREVRILVRDRDQVLSENARLASDMSDRTHAMEEARAQAERERERSEALLQDTSHRIGNSLATISSLLALQLLRSGSDEVRQALDAARSRVHVIASAHRRLRLGDDLETTSADQFLDAVLQDLAGSVATAKAVELVGEIEPIEIKAGDATTIGLLVGELVTNALNHAFPEGRGGCIRVALKKDTLGVPTLSVSDNGVGIDSASQAGEGLGSVIIKQLARQFGGVPLYQSQSEGGLRVIVPLPGISPGPAHS